MSEPKASILGLPAIDAGLIYAKLRYGVYLASASPIESLTRSKVPTLLITGTADSNIPMRHSIALHKVAPDHTELWIVAGAEHTGAMQAAPREFERRVIEWFGTHSSKAAN